MTFSAFLLASPLLLAPQAGPRHDVLTAAELAARSGAGRLEADGSWSLASGEQGLLAVVAPLPFRSFGAFWRGGFAVATSRLVRDDGSTSPVSPLVPNDDLTAGARGAGAVAPPDAVVGALHHGYGGDSHAVVLTITGPARLRDLTLVWVPGAAQGARRPSPPPFPGAAGHPKPFVYDRASWGADPPQCGYSYWNVDHLAVHHTASASEYWSTSWSECAANVKATQSYHMYVNGWCDVGYHYLVCVHGDLFEGRGGGDDVVGAHDAYNLGSMAVACMGYFHPPYSQTLTPAMEDAIAELGAWKCDQKGIDPLGASWYDGYGGVVANVYGHRDVRSTSCPGDQAYARLDAIRQAIAARLNGGGGQVVLDTDQLHLLGGWTLGSSSSDKYGADYRWTSTGTGSRLVAWWEPDVPSAGWYDVYLWWPQGWNRNPQTLVGARTPSGLTTTTVDQQHDGGRWNLVGTWWLPQGRLSKVGVANDGPAGWVVVADALRLVKR